jgi:hypothetical protein
MNINKKNAFLYSQGDTPTSHGHIIERRDGKLNLLSGGKNNMPNNQGNTSGFTNLNGGKWVTKQSKDGYSIPRVGRALDGSIKLDGIYEGDHRDEVGRKIFYAMTSNHKNPSSIADDLEELTKEGTTSTFVSKDRENIVKAVNKAYNKRALINGSKGAAVGAIAGYGIHRLRNAKEYKKFKFLKSLKTRTPSQELEYKSLKSQLLKSGIKHTLGAAALAGLGTGLVSRKLMSTD